MPSFNVSIPLDIINKTARIVETEKPSAIVQFALRFLIYYVEHEKTIESGGSGNKRSYSEIYQELTWKVDRWEARVKPSEISL